MPAALLVAGKERGGFKGGGAEGAGGKRVAGLGDSSERCVSPTPPSSLSHLSDSSTPSSVPPVTPAQAFGPPFLFYLQPIRYSSEAAYTVKENQARSWPASLPP